MPLICPNLQVTFIIRIKMVGIHRIIPLWVEHPKLLVAVVIPELGLQLMHLNPVLEQEEGAVDALRVLSHLGNQFFL